MNARRVAGAGCASDALARALEVPGVEDGLVGVEHEYRLARDGAPVDFRRVIHDLGLGVRGLDPGDEYAYRLPSGSTLTCDEAEAEIATPPEPLVPGFAGALTRRVTDDLAWLRGCLRSAVTVDGYTTHISVRVPEASTDRVARMFAETCAAPMMLMLDRDPAPGLLVRPRPHGRVEVCGWYAPPERIGSVVAFAAGTVLACAAAVSGTEGARTPHKIRARIDPAVIRYGWYVDRRAFGTDLYALGRLADLDLEDGGRITAQHHLQEAWELGRAALGDFAGETDRRPVDGIVAGHGPLPSEGDIPTETMRSRANNGPAAWAQLTSSVRRPRVDLAPVVVTWDFAVYVVASRRRIGFLNVPRKSFAVFLEKVGAGELDGVLLDYLDRRPVGRRLSTHLQTHAAALFDELGVRRALLPPERNPDASWAPT